jgi:DNA modification methylase
LQKLFERDSATQWEIGDTLIELVDSHGMTFKAVASRFGRARNTLSDHYHTAKAFPPGTRNLTLPWNHYAIAQRMAKEFDLTPKEALREIIRSGLTQKKAISAHFAEKQRQKNGRSGQGSPAATTLINKAHDADCRMITQALPDRSVKLTLLDLPYGDYGSAGPKAANSVARANCDGEDQDSVNQLLADMFWLTAPKMAPGGCAMLFRPNGIADPLIPKIYTEAEESGWEIASKVTWDKGRTKLGRSTAPYATRTEAIWVLCRAGDHLTNHDGSSRDDILDFPVPRYRSHWRQQYHLYEKPLELCQFLVSKHTNPGELVFDACGCSGNFSIAALQMGRRWIYSETNDTNFEWGAQRIAAAQEQLEKQKTG